MRSDRSKITSVIHIGADYTDEEREWFLAIERYKSRSGKKFLDCRDVLAVLKSLGYRKPASKLAQRRRGK